MKRSEINAIIREAEAFLRGMNFHLPPFACWTLDDWQHIGSEAGEIVASGLGWDITDFGLGDFHQHGLLLITLRNGNPADAAKHHGKLYCEKIMIVEANQITPLHFHWKKMEDIINRGGGKLFVRLYNATTAEKLDTENRVRISVDGVQRTIAAGGIVELKPGESITLPPYCYHSFWGDRRVLVGEVSAVNDDRTDNRFYDPIGRFPTIEEDVEPLHLLVTDYARFRPSNSHM